MFFRGDITQHRRTVPTDHGRTNSRGNVIVAGRNVGGQRTQGIERCFFTDLQLLVHVFLDHVHRHMPRAFDHGLHVVLPGNFRQLAQGFQFTKLGRIIGIGN